VQISLWLVLFLTEIHRKVIAYVAATGAGIQAMFFSDYDVQGFENQEHIFSNTQTDMRNWIDRTIYGLDSQKNTKPNEESESRTNNNRKE
jgi:hypothetical protein